MMVHSATLPLLLKQLRLATMARLWEEFLDRADQNNWDPAQYLTALCEEELNERYSRRVARNTKESRLPVGKTLASFDFKHLSEVQGKKIKALASDNTWVKQAQNILFFGASGSGKTHLAAALCYALIEQDIRVRYFPATVLVQQLQRARNELQLESVLAKLDRYAVIILDDIGYVKKNEMETHVLFELIAHRYETGSIIITSNHSFSDWDQIFADTIMTVAAIDRLVHHSVILEFQDIDSFRRKQALARKQKDSDCIHEKDWTVGKEKNEE